MIKYTLVYKLEKEDRFLYCPISATTLDEAIEETKRSIEYTEKRDGKIEKAYINSTKIEKVKVWERE